MAAPKEYHNYINGEWVGSSTGETVENVNPANTSEVVGIFPRSDKAQLEERSGLGKHVPAKDQVL